MNHVEIEEHQIVDRYLLGQLPNADADRFEEHFMVCQQCLDELELAERMQGAARTAAAEDVSRLARARGLAVFAWLARRGPWVQLATMAAVMLLPAAIALRTITERSVPAPPMLEQAPVESFAPQAGTPIISLRPQRSGPGSTPSLLLELSAEPRWLVFSVELEPPFAAAHRVILRRGVEEKEVWRIEDLQPDASGLLNVSFHSSFLATDDYLLVVDVVTPAGGSVLIGRHAFRVVAVSD